MSSKDKRIFQLVHDPATGSPRPILYDFATLEKLSYSNKEFERRLVTIFVETVPESVQKLKTAWITRDFPVLTAVAHKLKTTIHSMGIQQLREPIRRLEDLGGQKIDSTETERIMEEVHDTLFAITEEFKSKLI